MWIRKSDKDRQEGRCSPIPTQVVSNEEYIPMPQTDDQRRVERRIYELADGFASKRKMSRRQYLSSAAGMAAAFLAMNEVFGRYFLVDWAEAAEAEAGATGIDENGYLEWTTDIVKDRLETPEMTNVYMELGSVFGHTAITHPEICGHLMGQILTAFGSERVIWGTDSIWWGSPQWQIEAFRRFQIPEALQEKHGYPALSRRDKELILGLNAARLYGIDVPAAMRVLPGDGLSRLRAAYLEQGAEPSNTQYGWVREGPADEELELPWRTPA